MKEEMLLADPDWQRLTDPELARAVELAKARGRQTAELLDARSRETGELFLLRQLATVELYLVHCAKQSSDTEKQSQEWRSQTAGQICADPRVAWFCVSYQRARWHLLGNEEVPDAPLILLQKIRDHQKRYVHEIRHRYSMTVAMIHRQGDLISDPAHEAEIKRLQRDFVKSLDFAMLSEMTLNVATEEWIARSGPDDA
jgi:hypothetical protein